MNVSTFYDIIFIIHIMLTILFLKGKANILFAVQEVPNPLYNKMLTIKILMIVLLLYDFI